MFCHIRVFETLIDYIFSHKGVRHYTYIAIELILRVLVRYRPTFRDEVTAVHEGVLLAGLLDEAEAAVLVPALHLAPVRAGTVGALARALRAGAAHDLDAEAALGSTSQHVLRTLCRVQ